MHSNNNNRNNRDDSNNNVEYHVQKLFKNDPGNTNKVDRYINKIEDPKLREQVYDDFVSRSHKITKKAHKFAKLIRDKYSQTNTPFHIILGKARRFKDKYELTEEEFSVFQRIYEKDLSGKGYYGELTHNTKLTKVLGTLQNKNTMSLNHPKLSDNDYKTLQEIYKLYNTNKILHSQIFLQSYRYTDCSPEAIITEFDNNAGELVSDHIHPVLVALFLPKIESLDCHFLRSNLSEIIFNRFNDINLNTISNAGLYHALITDPNDIVCDNSSAMEDLLKRVQLQLELWNCVLHLRNGQYFKESFRNFITNIDTCNSNTNDDPNVIYGRNDGIILKRLLAAFSFRPTYVAVSTLPNTSIVNNPFVQNNIKNVINIPMINFIIPENIDVSVNLEDAINQSQTLFYNNTLIQKHTNIIYSRDVIFFHVDRRAHYISHEQFKPFNLRTLPIAMAGFERLNDTSVQVPSDITIKEETYTLRSVVMSLINETSDVKEHRLIIGSATLVKMIPSEKNGFIP